MSFSKVFPLHTVMQNYAWGKYGSQSEISSMIKNVCPHFVVEETKPYAELWMGTHPSGPSTAMLPDKKMGPLLSQVLLENPSYLGAKIQEKFGPDLPFLFKVLSVNTALSIQAHPNKTLAEELHKTKPDLYKDPNHKPEMALALTPFEALCGFRPFYEICGFLKSVPEFANLLGEDLCKEFIEAQNQGVSEQKKALKNAFTAVMKSSKNTIAEQLNLLIKRVESNEKAGNSTDNALGKLLLRIHKDFPEDVGCFGIYFLNYLQLKPGEAIYLGANEAHAYLYGDCIEIMACSDNTVRAGLTPKFIDVETLCEMLTYETGSAQSKLFPGAKGQDPHTIIYNPPIPDFTLAKIQVPPSITTYSLDPIDSASILLVGRGNAQAKTQDAGNVSLNLKRGSVLFIAASEKVQFEIPSGSNDDLLMFRAYCQL